MQSMFGRLPCLFAVFVQCVCSASLYKMSLLTVSVHYLSPLFLSAVPVNWVHSLLLSIFSVCVLCLLAVFVQWFCSAILFKWVHSVSVQCACRLRPAWYSGEGSLIFRKVLHFIWWWRHVEIPSIILIFLYDVTNGCIARIPFSIFVWFRFLIKQKILSRNLILVTLISNFSQKSVLISVRSLKYLTISEFIFEIPWVYISLKLLCIRISEVDLISENIVAYLKFLESLKSFLILIIIVEACFFRGSKQSMYPELLYAKICTWWK